MLYLALSCLQGRRQTDALTTLVKLSDRIGIQLTPGCAPSDLTIGSTNVRSHHGYSMLQLKTPVWSRAGACLWQGHSVHPPLKQESIPDWKAPIATDIVLETMYPGYADLSCGVELDRAMDEERKLAVDVSHIDIQRRLGVITQETIHRLFDYAHITEIHVSAARGTHDAHSPINVDTFGLAWARERSANLPIVLECYMHKLSFAQRQEQLSYLC